MKSTQIKKTKVLDWTVSTVFIEPFNYYETAVRDDMSRERHFEPREWTHALRPNALENALAQHDETVRILGAPG